MLESLISYEEGKYENEIAEEELLRDFCKKYKSIYVYGAGKYAEIMLDYLAAAGIRVKNVVVTQKDREEIDNIPIVSVTEIMDMLDGSCGLILTVKPQFQQEILKNFGRDFAGHNTGIYKVPSELLAMLSGLRNSLLYQIARRIPIWSRQFYAKKELGNKKWKKILIVGLEHAIGDEIWASAFIRELRRNFPKADITYVVNSSLSLLAVNCPYTDHVIEYSDCGRRYENLTELEERVAEFTEKDLDKEYDVVFLPKVLPYSIEEPLENVLIALYCKAPVRIAHAYNFYRWEKFWTELWKPLFPVLAIHDRAEHEVCRDLSLLKICSLSVSDERMEVWLSEKDIKSAEEILRAADNRVRVAFGLAGREARRNWPGGCYLELADMMLKKYGNRICFVLVGGENARGAADIVADSEAEIIDIAGKTDLLVSAAVIGKCDLYIGADTSLMHMAAASGVPVVELSANLSDGEGTDMGAPERTGPWGVEGIVLRPKWALDDCKKICTKLFTHCITQIRVNDVFNAANCLLKGKL